MYDYLIVGSGLFGAVFAHEAIEAGKKCLVVERREHIGGNCYTNKTGGIHVHVYGAHIFRTSSKEIWTYINKFAEFNNFINAPIANYKGELYNLPFNMNTFNKMWGVITPDEARRIIAEQSKTIVSEPQNLEEHAISLVGVDIYQKLIKEYTEKQWGRSCKDLPASIMRRLPLRFIYDNNYFSDRYQGVPIGGYTQIFEKMLTGCHVLLNTDYLKHKNEFNSKKIIYTGTIDSYFDSIYGPLEYRSLRFENEYLPVDNYQGVAVVNYTDLDTPYTRIIEHKHFEFGTQPDTIITREYPLEWTQTTDPYYPINDQKNQTRYEQYAALAKQEKNVIFGGRLGEYRYYDMQETIASALRLAKIELK
jgi:UDP-galactopyranose mutase